MSAPYAYTPYIWPMLASAVLMAALGVYGWRRRTVPGALPFVFSMLFWSLMAMGAVLELAAVDVVAKISWLKFQFFWQGPGAVAGVWFVLAYAHLSRFLTRRNLILLSVFPLLGSVLILTNDAHHWIWIGFSYSGGVVQPLRGSANWMLILIGFLLSLVSLLVLIWLFARSPQHRWPAAIMVCGQLTVRIGFLLDTANINPAAPMDPFILTSNVLVVTYAFALFGFRILDPIPHAYRTIVEQMRDGMLVLDAEDRIADLNSAALELLGAVRSQVIGQAAGQVLAALPDLAEFVRGPATQIEIWLTVDTELHCYQVSSSPLTDGRGVQLGRVIALHDITEVKRAHAQLVEQQRALAMLHERERLGRELHDNLGQVLGYVKMKVQIAREALVEEEKTAVDRHLTQLEAVVQEAHTDVRDYLLGLDARPPVETAFFSALREYLRRFGETYPIETDLQVSTEMADCALGPMVQVQLLRIIQEALTNTRKHAAARRVCVSASAANGRARIVIQDDGQGFDAAQAAQGPGQHYGLGFMRERAAEVGGSVEIDSAPSQGTRVVIQMPVNG
jgi:PAS domain S-box-containing protein